MDIFGNAFLKKNKKLSDFDAGEITRIFEIKNGKKKEYGLTKLLLCDKFAYEVSKNMNKINHEI